mgnify:CR=1 FL=1
MPLISTTKRSAWPQNESSLLVSGDIGVPLVYSEHFNRKATMNHALILNLAIVALIVAALLITSNPLALLAVAFIRDMPFGLLAQDDEEEADEKGRPIGFVHHED